MVTVGSAAQLEGLKNESMLLILFGSMGCGVCQALKPGLQAMTSRHFPDVILAYVDCASLPAVCAQHMVFALPAVKLYVEGQLAIERARSFSLHELGAQIERLRRLRPVGPQD